jgi:hypothetical protein
MWILSGFVRTLAYCLVALLALGAASLLCSWAGKPALVAVALPERTSLDAVVAWLKEYAFYLIMLLLASLPIGLLVGRWYKPPRMA